MKRKLTIAVCCAVLLSVLPSCQLAKESIGLNETEDRLIGIFITTEHIDLFDFDSYLEDNIGSIQGGEFTIDGNTQEYQGRLYATMTSKSETSEETGLTMTTEEYTFEGIDGMSYFAPIVRAAEGHDNYTTVISDEAFSDGHTTLNHGDDESSITLEATVYVAPSGKMQTYYYNPVYQSADGSVYVVSGSGHSFYAEPYGEGAVYSQTIESSTTTREDGKDKTDSISIKASISVMCPPVKTVIIQMDQESAILSQSEYEPDEVPNVIELESDTDYFIVETHKQDETEIKISREIYDRGVEDITTFSARADGVCIRQWTQII